MITQLEDILNRLQNNPDEEVKNFVLFRKEARITSLGGSITSYGFKVDRIYNMLLNPQV